MSEIDDLAKDLGIDTEDLNEDSREVEVSNVDTQLQIEASEELISSCRELYKAARQNDLIWRWELGKRIDETYENKEKYEEGVLKKLSRELDIGISDLSRFRKFYKSFNKEMLEERVAVGYSWSHFKMINDLPDGDIKTRMISLMEQEDEAPKTKELQQTINQEREAQFDAMDDDGSGATTGSTSDGESKPKKTSSPNKPVNSALKTIDKLIDFMSDIYMQEEAGIDWDTDSQESKYNELIDELKSRLDNLDKISKSIWK